MNKQLQEHIEHVLPKKHTYLIAVSGGLDSMALLHLLHSLQYKVSVAHINYQLRGQDSNADQQLVAEFCKEHTISLYTKNVDTNLYLQQHKIGVQEGARQIRYDFFKQIIAEQQIHAVVTAHHANDQIETVLLNMARGTGLHGLTGMQTTTTLHNIKVIRPFLLTTKNDILEYINQNNITFREDSSNAKSDYTRNAVRNEVIPAWQKADNRFENNMLHNIETWTNTSIIYNAHVNQTISKINSQRGNDLFIHINALLKLKPCEQWLFEIVKKYNFNYLQTLEIYKILKSANGKLVANENYRAIKQNDFIIITSLATIDSDNIIINNDAKKIEFANGFLQFDIEYITNKTIITNTNNIALLDADNIAFPLLLRKWKEGDYFYPLGMPKKKKIARFLIDAKATLLQKENTWVLVSNNKIIWLVNNRIDNRVKITDTTKKYIQIKYQNTNA